jgi:Tfp pilus assembly protein PilF
MFVERGLIFSHGSGGLLRVSRNRLHNSGARDFERNGNHVRDFMQAAACRYRQSRKQFHNRNSKSAMTSRCAEPSGRSIGRAARMRFPLSPVNATGAHGATATCCGDSRHGLREAKSRRTAMRPVFSIVSIPSACLAVPLLLAAAPASHGAETSPGSKPKIAIAAFGLDGDQSVFESEAKRAAAVVSERFGSDSVIVRSNTKHREDANTETVAATLQSAAKTIDAENGVLFVILTSHGSQAGLDVKAGAHEETLSPINLVTALNDAPARYRVIIVSACYSGVFIRPLADPNTLVITAADSTHSSFGCRNGNQWTYFGDAFFNTALRHTANLRAAFAEATSLVRKRERAKRLAASNPQMSGGENVEHVLRGEPDQVTAYARDGSGLDPKYAFSRGVASGARGDYDTAITAYGEAIQSDPKYPIAYNNRGVAYFKKGDNDHAIADYAEAIRLDPKVPSAWANRARAYREKGEHDRAIADYSKAIKIDAKFAAAYNNRGMAYAAKGDHGRAIADYTQAIKLDPKLANAYENRGRAYQAKGDGDRASRDFEEAIRIDPKLADTLKAPSAKQ